MGEHRDVFVDCVGEQAVKEQELLDYYEEALKQKCRECMPITSLSQDRRTGEYVSTAYNDDTIHCYMCFICAEKHLHLAGFDRAGDASHYKGSIEYHAVGKLMQAIEGNDKKWEENFDFALWMERYAPRIQRFAAGAEEAEHGFCEESWEWKRNIDCVRYKDALQNKQALCCPEDVRRHPSRCCHDTHTLCRDCSVPICMECWSRVHSRSGYKIPAALANDNFQGYIHPFIVLNKVRWIEAVTACPLGQG